MQGILRRVLFFTAGLVSLTSCLLTPVPESGSSPVAGPIREEPDADRVHQPVSITTTEVPEVIVYVAPEFTGDTAPKLILPKIEMSDVHTPRSPDPRGPWSFTPAVPEPAPSGNDLPEIEFDHIVNVLSPPTFTPPVMETPRNTLGFYEKVTILLRLAASIPPEMPLYLAVDDGTGEERPDSAQSDSAQSDSAPSDATRELPERTIPKPEPPAAAKRTAGSGLDHPPAVPTPRETKEGSDDRSDDVVVDRDRQRILARPGDDIEISFDENGWVYLGAGDREATLSGIAFLGKQIKEGGSVFAFNASELGDYELSFLHQDNRAGLQKKVILDVLVLEEGEFDQRLGEEGGDGGSLTLAEELRKAGRKTEALNEYLRIYREGDPLLNDRIAAIYWADQEFEKAAVYWNRNRDLPGEFGERAVLGIVNSAVATDDRVSLFQNIDALLAIESVSIAEDVINLVRYFMSTEDYSAARRVLLGFLMRIPVPGERRLDEAYYLMGQIYEAGRDLEDLKEAKRAYTRVINDFPDSPFYSSAEERIRYLNRHFFYLQ